LIHSIILNDENNPQIMGLKVIPIEDKLEAEAQLEDALKQLGQIYTQVPRTRCNKCGNCCDGTKTGNPVVYSIEYLNIMRVMNAPANRELKLRIYGSAMMIGALLDRKEKEAGSSRCGQTVNVCPVVDHQTKLCLLYQHRPLICRLYGLDGWVNGPDGWVRQAGPGRCDQVKIDQDSQSLCWSDNTGNSLLKQLKRLSAYYYIDEIEKTVFNANVMTDWLTLKLRR
jgi:Fe-S-cluster containining protein